MEESVETQEQEAREKAAQALKTFIPLLEKHGLNRWCISGGFACYLYGVNRPIGDIDIDIEADKDQPSFQGLVKDTKQYTKNFPFQLWIDQNYDNWVMNVVIEGQTLSVCDTAHLKLFNKETGEYKLFYPDGIPDPVVVEFEGLQLHLAPKESVLRMREALAYKKDAEITDIEGMKKIILPTSL